MKLIKLTIFGALMLTTISFSGCNDMLEDENATFGHGKIEVGFTRSSNGASISSTSTSGCLVFWQKDFGDFHIAEVDNLESYNIDKDKFNTGKEYPKDNSTVYATGYSPASMERTSNAETITLSEDHSGKTDVCVASGKIEGKRSVPFNAEMTFEHTLTKIYFTVERHSTMVGIRDVRNITATIPNAYLPIEWNWESSTGKYVLNGSKTAKDDLIFTHPDIINATNTEELGTAYLMMPTGKNDGTLKDIRLTADLLLTTSSKVERTIDEKMNIQLYDEDGAKVSEIKPGEAYIVNILFQQNTFTLTARQLNKWEQGGLIYVPIKP